MRLARFGIMLGLIAPAALNHCARAQETMPAAAPKITSSYDQVVRFTADPSTMADKLMPFALGNRELQLQAVKEVSEEAAKEPLSKVMSMNFFFGKLLGPGVAVPRLQVESFDERVPAKKLSAAIINGVLKWLLENDVEHQADQRNVDLLQQRLGHDVNELEKEENTLRTLLLIHKVGPSPEQNRQRQQRLEQEVDSSQVLLAGLNVRRHLLEKQIAEIGKQASASSADDSVVQELVKAIRIREQIMEIMVGNNAKVAGSVTQGQLLDAQRQIAEAKAELAKARRDSVQAVGGQRLADLRRRLDDTIIDISENEARKKVLEKQFQDASKTSGQAELQSMKVELLKENYRARAKELNELRAKLSRYQAPQATVLQSSDTVAPEAK
jgi:hypothetical protein